MKYQTLNTLEFHDEPIMGFKVYNITDKGGIYFNNYKFTFNLDNPPIPLVQSTTDQTQIVESWKWNRAVELLKNDSSELVSKFDYFNISNQYIHAINKTDSLSALIQLRYFGGVSGYPDTYPRENWSDWEEIYFPGVNNPATWNYLRRAFKEHSNIFENPLNSELMLNDYVNTLNGCFNMSDSFISSKDVTIPLATPVFFVFDNYSLSTPDTQYKWELWDVTRDVLLIRSNKSYFIWNFVTEGTYSVRLWVNNQISQFYKEKVGCIRVVKEI
jgi:hypothetical protein